MVCLTILFVVIFAKCVAAPCRCWRRRSVGPGGNGFPFITTIVDATSLLIYFALASALIPALHAVQ